MQEPVRDSDSGGYFNCWEEVNLQMWASFLYFGLPVLHVQDTDEQSVYICAIPLHVFLCNIHKAAESTE